MKTKQSLKTLSFVFILALLSSSLHAQEFIRELVTVIKITDGDTLWVRYEGQREKLRLIGSQPLQFPQLASCHLEELWKMIQNSRKAVIVNISSP